MIQNLITCGKIHSCVFCGQSTELCSHSHHPHDCFLCPLTAVHVSCLSFSIIHMYTCLPIHTPCIYTGHCHLPYLVVLITVCLSDRRSNDEHSRATLGPPPCSPLTSCVSLSILFNLCASIYSFLKWDNSTICSIGSLTGSLTQCLASRKSSRIISSIIIVVVLHNYHSHFSAEQRQRPREAEWLTCGDSALCQVPEPTCSDHTGVCLLRYSPTAFRKCSKEGGCGKKGL